MKTNLIETASGELVEYKEGMDLGPSMKTKFEPDFDAADEAVDRLKRLTQRPEPERGDWNAYMATALVDLDRALMSPETRRLHAAAPALLAAAMKAQRQLESMCATAATRRMSLKWTMDDAEALDELTAAINKAEVA